MIVVTRFGIQTDGPPLQERATYIPASGPDDPQGVPVPAFDGLWLLVSVSEPLVDVSVLYEPPKVDAWGNVIELGGLRNGPIRLYDLPLAPGVMLAGEQEYLNAVAAWLADHGQTLGGVG